MSVENKRWVILESMKKTNKYIQIELLFSVCLLYLHTTLYGRNVYFINVYGNIFYQDQKFSEMKII